MLQKYSDLVLVIYLHYVLLITQVNMNVSTKFMIYTFPARMPFFMSLEECK
jgi:hypothetical protein